MLTEVSPDQICTDIGKACQSDQTGKRILSGSLQRIVSVYRKEDNDMKKCGNRDIFNLYLLIQDHHQRKINQEQSEQNQRYGFIQNGTDSKRNCEYRNGPQHVHRPFFCLDASHIIAAGGHYQC